MNVQMNVDEGYLERRVEVFAGDPLADGVTKKGRFYWRRKSPNGKIVADGAESYTRKADCVTAAHRENPGLHVYVIDDDGTEIQSPAPGLE